MIDELGLGDEEGLVLVYDGECPFCSAYVKLYRIRQAVGRVDMIDARSRPDMVQRLVAAGFDLNDGMVAIWKQSLYYGADCIHLMSMLSADRGLFAKLNAALFRNERIAGSVYPVLVAGRRLTLRALGRAPL